MNKFKYRLAMFLTFLQAPFMFIGIILLFFSNSFWTFMYERNKLNQSIREEELSKIIMISTIIGIVILVINLLIMKPITNFRQTARENMKFDSYGRLKDEGEYKKLSVKEQKELDKERVREMNRILPAPVVKQMTKNGSDNPEKELNDLIGLREAKDTVFSMMARMQLNKNNGKNQEAKNSQHMVFYGPPGTGKTTVARIMTGILYQNNYIGRNELIETSGSFFLDNNASKKMQAMCQRAYGGVLFIDEAYAMAYSSQGTEAIAELIKNMEDARDKFILILAGYKDEMKELLELNPGFYSRIKYFVKFDDYNNDELFDILKYSAKKQGVCEITNDAKIKFMQIMDNIRYDDDFGNARTVINLLDQSISKEALLRKIGKSQYNFNDPIVLNESNITYKKNELII